MNFTVTAGPSVRVIAPNGGEQWQLGVAHTISWQSTNPPPGASLGLALYKGGVYRPELFRVYYQPLTGSFSWTPSVTIPPGNDYTMEAEIYNGTILVVYDRSDAPFSIVTATTTTATTTTPTITDVSPNPASPGTLLTITGSRFANTAGGVNTVCFFTQQGGTCLGRTLVTTTSTIQLQFPLPSLAAGTYYVRVYTSQGGSNYWYGLTTPSSPPAALKPTILDDKVALIAFQLQLSQIIRELEALLNQLQVQ